MANRETLYQVADRVATITLNRPDKLNAWTAIMEGEVRAAMGIKSIRCACQIPADKSHLSGFAVTRT